MTSFTRGSSSLFIELPRFSRLVCSEVIFVANVFKFHQWFPRYLSVCHPILIYVHPGVYWAMFFRKYNMYSRYWVRNLVLLQIIVKLCKTNAPARLGGNQHLFYFWNCVSFDILHLFQHRILTTMGLTLSIPKFYVAFLAWNKSVCSIFYKFGNYSRRLSYLK